MKSYRVTLLLAAAAFFIFGGYSGLQQFLVVLYEEDGQNNLASIALAVVYALLVFAPYYVGSIASTIRSGKLLVCIGAVTYAIFIAAASTKSVMIVVGAVALGIGAALWWSVVPYYIAHNVAERYRVRHNAILHCMLSSGAILGSMVITTMHISMYWFVLGPVIGVCILLALPDIEILIVKQKMKGLYNNLLLRWYAAAVLCSGITVGSTFGIIMHAAKEQFGIDDTNRLGIGIQIAVPAMQLFGGVVCAGYFGQKRTMQLLAIPAVISPFIVGIGCYVGSFTIFAAGVFCGIMFTAGVFPIVQMLVATAVSAEKRIGALSMLQGAASTGIVMAMFMNFIDNFIISNSILILSGCISGYYIRRIAREGV